MPNKTELKKSFRVVNVEGTSAFGQSMEQKTSINISPEMQLENCTKLCYS